MSDRLENLCVSLWLETALLIICPNGDVVCLGCMLFGIRWDQRGHPGSFNRESATRTISSGFACFKLKMVVRIGIA